MGRPSKFKRRFIKDAQKLVALGATDKDLADFFNTTERTIRTWKDSEPAFLPALKKAKDNLDAQVEQSLFRRAMGYNHPEDDIRVCDNQIVVTPTIKHYPPSEVACIFWLKNRQPGRWRDKIEHDMTVAGTWTIVSQISPDDLTGADANAIEDQKG